MPPLSLSVNFLAANSNTPLLATDANKEAPQDGFQALLDIGNDITSVPQKGAVANTPTFTPGNVANDQPVEYRQDDGYENPVKPAVKKEAANDLARDDSSRTDDGAHAENPADKTRPAEHASKKEASFTKLKTGKAEETGEGEAILPVNGIELKQELAALREVLFGLLAQLSGQTVTDDDSAQQAIDFLLQSSKPETTGQGSTLPPGLLAQLQALLKNLQAADGKDLLQAGGMDFDGLLAQLQQLSGDETQKDNGLDNKTIAQLTEKLANLVKVAEVIANRPDSQQVDAPEKSSLSALLTKISPSAAGTQDNPVVENKSQQAAALAANVQGSVKVEAAAAKSGGFDTQTGPRDGAPIFTLPRNAAQTESASQANTLSFARVLQSARPVIDQIVFHIKTAPLTGNSRIHVQLHPAELGRVEIKMDVDADGKTGITVTADNKNTLDLLQRDRSGLERALADAGLKADSGDLNFNLRGEQQQGQDQNSFKGPLPYVQLPQEEPQPIEQLLTVNHTVDLALGLDIKI